MINLIAIEAPAYGTGRYTIEQIRYILQMAYSGFRAAVLESADRGRACGVHTGFWGCGAYGGNRRLMAMLQVLAAHLAGVDRLVFHGFDEAGADQFEEARHLLEHEVVEDDCPLAITVLIQRLAGLGLEWGVSDGT